MYPQFLQGCCCLGPPSTDTATCTSSILRSGIVVSACIATAVSMLHIVAVAGQTIVG